MAELGAEAAKDLATQLNIPEDKAMFILAALSAGKSVGAKAISKKYIQNANQQVDVDHSIGADYNRKKDTVNGGHSLLAGDVRIKK